MARLIAGADETELLRAEKAALEELLAVQENCVIEQSERLEKALCERIASEEKFQVLFEHSSEGHMILDGNSVVGCNQAAVLMLGAADKRQALGIDLRCFSPGLQPDGQTSLDKFAEMISLAGASGSHRFDWTFLRFDGRELPVELTLTRVEIGESRS
jgi:PAS domain-containing protein